MVDRDALCNKIMNTRKIVLAYSNPDRADLLASDINKYHFWELELKWICTRCGGILNEPTIIVSDYCKECRYHTFKCSCGWGFISNLDIAEQVKNGQRIGKILREWNGKEVDWEKTILTCIDNEGARCKTCGIYCPYTDQQNLVCWSCKNYPFYTSDLSNDVDY